MTNRIATALFAGFVTGISAAPALAGNCSLLPHQSWLPAIDIQLDEQEVSALFTIENPARKAPVYLHLTRESVTRLETGEKMQILFGKATIKDGPIENEISVSILDEKEGQKNRLMDITTTMRIEGVTPQETRVAGWLICQ